MRERTTPTKPLELPVCSAASAGFEVPLEMLAACHSRVRAQCATLRRLAEHLTRHGADRQAQDAAAAVMRDFDAAAAHHHADEEVDLFPALIESMAGSDAVCLRELTASLTTEHRELEQRWRALRTRLEQVTRADAVTLPDGEVQGLMALCERHIAREEAELLPMAARLLSDAELHRIGLAMRARRGAIEPTGLPQSSPA